LGKRAGDAERSDRGTGKAYTNRGKFIQGKMVLAGKHVVSRRSIKRGLPATKRTSWVNLRGKKVFEKRGREKPVLSSEGKRRIVK